MTGLGDTLAALKARQDGQSSGGLGRLVDVRRFGTNPGELRMRMYAPVSRSSRAALVVVLHGCTQCAAEYAEPAGWLDLAERFGFVMIAPEQTRQNNPNLCFNWYQRSDIQKGQGEAQSIAQMVSHAVSRLDLDGRRVFVTGLSAGGAMANVMLATYPEMFAGGAIVAGLPYGVASTVGDAFQVMAMETPPRPELLGDLVRDATEHRGPWPTVSVWHGRADHVVRLGAGAAVAAQWRDVHGATGPARRARTPDGRDFQLWLSPGGDPVVEMHSIAGLGHGAAIKSDGVDSFGSVSRYTPDVGVASSYEIAMSWGLAEPVPERAGADAHPVGPPDARISATRQPDDPSIKGIIDSALRAAGLVK